MPRIIDVTSSGTRRTNAINDGLQQSLSLALPLIDRLQRQNAERDRMARDDREFGFRQQQAERQQSNTDRSFGLQEQGLDQRQQVIDRQFESEDAAAAYYRGQLEEMNPGPVGAGQFDGMDSQTMRGIVETERYAKQLDTARARTESAAKQVIDEYGILASSPQTAERLAAMIEGAATIEELDQAREAVWEIAKQTEEIRADAVLREQTVMGMEPMLAPLAQRPADRAMANVAVKQYLAGELDIRQFLGVVADAVEKSQGGGSEARTTGTIARQKMVDAYVTANPNATDKNIDAMVANADRLRDRIDGKRVDPSSAASRPAASPIADKMLDSAAKFVGRKTDEAARLEAAMVQAKKLARANGIDPADEDAMVDLAGRILDQANR